jgi:hypothetical protein
VGLGVGVRTKFEVMVWFRLGLDDPNLTLNIILPLALIRNHNPTGKHTHHKAQSECRFNISYPPACASLTTLDYCTMWPTISVVHTCYPIGSCQKTYLESTIIENGWWVVIVDVRNVKYYIGKTLLVITMNTVSSEHS